MGMTKQEVLNSASGKQYLAIFRKLLRGSSIYKDLHQDLLVKLLGLPESKFKNIECLDCFLYVSIKNIVIDYKRKAKKEKSILLNEGGGKFYDGLYNYSEDFTIKKTKRLIETLSWHDKNIAEEWISGKSDRRIASEKEVPRHFVTKKIKQIKEKIRQEIKVNQLESPIKILLVVQPNTTALQYHRQYVPHERLKKTHGNEFSAVISHGNGEEASIDNIADEQLREFQMVYYLRQVSFIKEKIDPTLERIKKLGLKVILDIDDYWHLPTDHHWYDKYKEKNVAKSTIDTIKKVDWVITTTNYFADKIKKYNKNVTVIPNCISPDAKQFERRSIESGRMRFGWIGGVFHRPDIDEMEESFKLLNGSRAKEIKDDFQVSVGGFSCNYEYKEIEKTFTANYSFRNTDATYYNYLQQCTPTMEHIAFDKYYRRLWGRDIYSYGELYNEIDVAIVPLKDSTFNRCKSELKIVEAGWMKKAVVCSMVTPYQEWIKHEKNGLLVNPSRNNIDWFLAIRRLTMNPSLVEDMGEALHETITKNFDLDTHNKTRAELYKSLI